MFTSVNSRAISAYKRVAAETSVQAADPHQLVQLLFDALFQSISNARGAMQRRDIPAKGAAIAKAIRIIEEGLKAGLNLEQGGDIAANLRQLYEYSVFRLTQANLKNDATILTEVVSLIEPVAEAWKRVKGPAPAYLQTVAGQEV